VLGLRFVGEERWVLLDLQAALELQVEVLSDAWKRMSSIVLFGVGSTTTQNLSLGP
jgi:hypothetical protein